MLTETIANTSGGIPAGEQDSVSTFRKKAGSFGSRSDRSFCCVREEDTNGPQTGRRSRWQCSFSQWDTMLPCCVIPCAPAVFPTALLELAEAMKLIHAHAAEWGVKEDQIYVEGCSAGGHLAASLGVFWHESWISERAGVTNEILRPAGLISLLSGYHVRRIRTQGIV